MYQNLIFFTMLNSLAKIPNIGYTITVFTLGLENIDFLDGFFPKNAEICGRR